MSTEPVQRRHSSWKFYANVYEALLLVLFLTALAHQLLIYPFIGMANNADFNRVLAPMGIHFTTFEGIPPEESPEYNIGNDPNLIVYVNRTYKKGESYQPFDFYSSAFIVAQLAKTTSNLFQGDKWFDIRFLGFFYILLYAGGLVSLRLSLTGFHRAAKVVFSSLLFLIFLDTGYFAYLNSFYAEPASLVFFFWMVSLLIWTWRSRNDSKTFVILNGLFVCFTLLFLIAKIQNTPLSILISTCWFCLMFLCRLADTRIHRRHLLITGGIISIIILAVSIVCFGKKPFGNVSVYNQVFFTLLKHSSTPTEDIKELNLNQEYETLIGTPVFETKPEQLELVLQAIDDVSHKDVVLYYLRHPWRYLQLLRIGAESAFVFRIDLGNFLPESGMPPHAVSKAFSQWSWAKRVFFPDSLIGMFLLFVVLLAIACFGMRNIRKRPCAIIMLFLITAAVMQYNVVLLGEGEFEAPKHLFLFNILVDLSIAFAAMMIIEWMIERKDNSKAHE